MSDEEALEPDSGVSILSTEVTRAANSSVLPSVVLFCIIAGFSKYCACDVLSAKLDAIFDEIVSARPSTSIEELKVLAESPSKRETSPAFD